MQQVERKQLGAFLKSRRARLNPQDVGLPAGIRRRTGGLRREEVATLAGVSITWYTWIEQGRDISVSLAVLERLAHVLRLSTQERSFLLRLASPIQEAAQAGEQAVDATLQLILDHQEPCPAYILGRYWDILAWNQAACWLFGDFATFAPAARNMLWYTFAEPQARLLVVDWAVRARRLLAEFRADCGRYLREPAMIELIERVRVASPEFTEWWDSYDIQTRDGGRREFLHPVAGPFVLLQTTFVLSNQPDLKLVLHIPPAGQASMAELRHAGSAGC